LPRLLLLSLPIPRPKEASHFFNRTLPFFSFRFVFPPLFFLSLRFFHFSFWKNHTTEVFPPLEDKIVLPPFLSLRNCDLSPFFGCGKSSTPYRCTALPALMESQCCPLPLITSSVSDITLLTLFFFQSILQMYSPPSAARWRPLLDIPVRSVKDD